MNSSSAKIYLGPAKQILAAHGNTAVLGSPENDNKGCDLYLCKIQVDGLSRPNWKLHMELMGMNEQTLVVGSNHDDNNEINNGPANVFMWDESSWSHQAKLLAPDGVFSDIFGCNVVRRDGTIIIDVYFDHNNFVRSRATWTHQAKLLAPDEIVKDWFGASVGVFGDTVIVCAYQDGDNGAVPLMSCT
ncbi:hypothetical protein ACHAWF_013652 [Thalassiosira exigua]